MHKEQLQEARTNPEFLKYLEKTKIDAIATKNISALYEVLDSFLVLDIDETKVNEVYKNILQISFDEVQLIINDNKKLNLENDNLFYVRAFYEHAIEKWSYDDFDGAKSLIFVLSNILDDDILLSALNAHLIALSKNTSLDNFYKIDVNLEACGDDEIYGYFITEFNYNLKEYLESNNETIKKEHEKLKHLLDK
jgi:regulator of replication initiation timing